MLHWTLNRSHGKCFCCRNLLESSRFNDWISMPGRKGYSASESITHFQSLLLQPQRLACECVCAYGCKKPDGSMGKSICTGSAEEDSSLYQEHVNVFGNNSSRTRYNQTTDSKSQCLLFHSHFSMIIRIPLKQMGIIKGIVHHLFRSKPLWLSFSAEHKWGYFKWCAGCSFPIQWMGSGALHNNIYKLSYHIVVIWTILTVFFLSF